MRRGPNGPGYVYLVRCEQFHKIGSSSDPEGRLKSLDCSPFPVELRHCIETDDMVWLERVLQKRYADKRHRGEWFLLDDSDVAAICAISRQDFDETIAPARKVLDRPWATLGIAADVAHLLKIVCAYRGQSTVEYTRENLLPAVRADLLRVVEQASKGHESSQPPQ